MPKYVNKGNENNYKNSIELIESHNLFTEGLCIFKDNLLVKDVIKQKFIDFLIKRKKYKQALDYVVLDTNKSVEVLLCCQKVMDWKTGYRYFKKHAPSELSKFLNEMLKLFIKEKVYNEAARIHIRLKSPLPVFFALLLKSKAFKKAKKSLVGNVLSSQEKVECQSELNLAFSIESNSINMIIKSIAYWKSRLEIVQKIKLTAILNLEEGIDIGDDISYQSKDSVSSRNSDSSKVSKFTGMSLHFKSKNKKPKNLTSRKHKEGSLYEEEWLVESLNNSKIEKDQMKNWSHFLSLLIIFEMIEQFEELKKSLEKFFK